MAAGPLSGTYAGYPNTEVLFDNFSIGTP